MSKRVGVHRDQRMLLPETVEDYVTADNPTRVVDAFVETLNLEELGFEQRKEGRVGAPMYDPAAFLKLYIYGYLNRIRSSRELEKATRRNLEVIWLMRKLQPDHWTINEFRKKHSTCFKRVFREFNLVCGQLGLFGGELIAIDSAYFKGVNNPANNYTKTKLASVLRKIDQQTSEFLAQLEANDETQQKQGAPECRDLEQKLKDLQEKRAEANRLMEMIEQSPTGQISLADPDSRCLKKAGQSVIGYHVQIAVDARNKLIVANETLKTGGDVAQLFNMSMQAKEMLGVEKLNAVADRGYYNVDQIKACDENGITSFVPEQRENKTGDGSISSKDFIYNEEKDVLICPMGQELHRHKDEQIRDTHYQVYYNSSACRRCPIVKQCASGPFRKIKMQADYKVIDALRERLKQHPQILKDRTSLVEHPFGSMKFWMGCGAFLTRGWKKVAGEIDLTTLAYNMKRALNIVATSDLLEFLKARKLEARIV